MTGKLRIITRLTARLKAAKGFPASGARRPGLRHTFGQSGQDFRPLFGDRDRVFDVRAGLPVECDDRPAVLEGLRLVRAHVEHRLDGEDVARTDFDARARLSVVRDLRVFVHFSADAVADVVAHDAVAVCLGERLHGPADVAEVLARPALKYRALKTLLGDADKLKPVLAHLRSEERRVGKECRSRWS